MKIWMLFFLKMLLLQNLEVGVQFGEPTRECLGRGQICSMEAKTAEEPFLQNEWPALLSMEAGGTVRLLIVSQPQLKEWENELFGAERFLLDQAFRIPDAVFSRVALPHAYHTLPAGQYPVWKTEDGYLVEFSILE